MAQSLQNVNHAPKHNRSKGRPFSMKWGARLASSPSPHLKEWCLLVECSDSLEIRSAVAFRLQSLQCTPLYEDSRTCNVSVEVDVDWLKTGFSLGSFV